MSILRVILFVVLSGLLSLTSSELERLRSGEFWNNYEGCKKPGQSPIALSSAQAQKDDVKTNVEFNWDRKKELTNFTLAVTCEYVFCSDRHLEENLTMDGNTYRFDTMHFHWGSDASKGSEHSIDGKFSSGEITITNIYDSYALIVSVLLQEEPGLEEDVPVMKDLRDILDKVKDHKKIGAFLTSVNITKSSLSDLIPTDGKLFRYTGSSSVPDCESPLERLVFRTPLKVTSKFFAILRDLKCEGVLMSDNFRPIQNFEDRTVYKSFD